MTIIIAIIILLWSVSALVRRADNKRTAKQINNVSKRTAKVEKNVINLEINIEKLAKEQEKQEERIAKLEQRMNIAEGEIEFQRQQIERLRKHIEHAETERDACVYGSSNYYKWDKKCMTLEKQIHSAENKLYNAECVAKQSKEKLGVA